MSRVHNNVYLFTIDVVLVVHVITVAAANLHLVHLKRRDQPVDKLQTPLFVLGLCLRVLQQLKQRHHQTGQQMLGQVGVFNPVKHASPPHALRVAAPGHLQHHVLDPHL
jgi:hypothetical protein